MSGQSVEYWQEKWNNYIVPEYNDITNDVTYKLLHLLKEYAAFSGSSFYTSAAHELFDNELGWFFNGRWGSHHTGHIKNAIGNYFHAAGSMRYNRAYHKVEVVFALIKEELDIANSPLDQNGDLFRIIQVAENNTGIQFAAINYCEILKKTEIAKLLSNEDPEYVSKELRQKIKTIEFKWDHIELYNKMSKLAHELHAEYNSTWPYPNKPLKLIKLNAILEMFERIFDNLEPIETVIADIKSKNPQELLEGDRSTRTRELFDFMESRVIVSNPSDVI